MTRQRTPLLSFARSTIGVLAVILLLAPPASAQITPGDPFTLERDAVYNPAFGDQFFGSVCAGPDEYFTVWVDLRTGGLAPAGYDLYAQRTSRDGTTQTPGSIELLRDIDRTTLGVPGVACNGSMYLVAWHEGSTLYAMRVDLEGNPIDEGGFVVASRTTLRWPSIASDGDGFLIAQGGRDGSIYATRIAADGSVLDPAGIVLDSGATAIGFPRVVYADGAYMIVWSRLPSGYIRGSRVTSDGTRLDPIGGFRISDGTFDVDPHIDFDGQDFFVVWSRQNGVAFDLYGAHVLTQGGPSPTPANLLLEEASFGAISNTQIAWNGSHHLVSITTGEPLFSNSDLYALRVDADGFADGGPFPVSTRTGESAVGMGVVSIDDQWFVAWEANYVLGVSFVYNIEGARVDADGRVLDRPRQLSVSNSASWQIASATAFDGQNFFTVFEDWRRGPPTYPSDLYAIRTSTDGTPIDATANLVASLGSVQGQPDIAGGDGQVAVVFESGSGAVNEIRMARLGADGITLSPRQGELIFAGRPTAEAFQPRIAWNGTHYCVVWYTNFPRVGAMPLQFALVDPDGTIAVGPVQVVASDWASQDGFDVTTGPDGEFLLAWTASDPGGVRATRIGPDGTILGNRFIQGTGSWVISGARPAWNGDNYLIAWSQWGDGGVRIDARPVASDLRPIGVTTTVAGPYQRTYSAENFPTPSGFLIAGGRTVGNNIETYLAPVDADGAPTGDNIVLQTADRDDTGSGSSFAIGAGRVMASHSLWASNPYNTLRMHGQMIDLGTACRADFDGDGELTIFDFLAFQNAFDAGDLAADFDDDGQLTIFDFLAFQNEFDAGCE